MYAPRFHAVNALVHRNLRTLIIFAVLISCVIALVYLALMNGLVRDHIDDAMRRMRVPGLYPSEFAERRLAALAEQRTPGTCGAYRTRVGALAADQHQVSVAVATVLAPLLGVHPLPVAEQALMASAVCFLAPTVVFEWGTHLGVSARAWYEIRRHFGLHYDIHTYDLPPDVPHPEQPGAERGALLRGLPGQIELHTNDAVMHSTALWNSVYKHAAHPLPLFFLDGDHGRDTVFRELTTIYRAVGCRAQFLVHDTLPRPHPASDFADGPWRAVQDFIAHHNGYRVYSAHAGLPGMTLLYSTDNCADIEF